MKSDMEVVIILFVVVFLGDSFVFANVHVIIGSEVDLLGFVLVVFLAVVILLVVVLIVVVLLVVVVLFVVVVLLVVVVVLLVVVVFAVVVVIGRLVVRIVVVVDLVVGPTSELVIALGLILLKIFSCHQGIVDENPVLRVGLVFGYVGRVVVQNNILAGILLLVVSADVVLGDMEVVVLILVVVFVGSGNKEDAENMSESNFSSARFAFV